MSDVTFEHHRTEWGGRIFADHPAEKSSMLEYTHGRDGQTTYSIQPQRHVQELTDELHRHHPDATDRNAAPTKAPAVEAEPTGPFFHGTTAPLRGYVRPAEQHGKHVTFEHDTSREHAYATSKESDAWSYAEKAWSNSAKGHPRVYEVAPTGPHEKDPEHHSDGSMRGNYAGDRRSRHPWKVVREVPMPEHMGTPRDWNPRARKTSARTTTWYHGTSTEHLPSIRQHGLDRPHLTSSPEDAADYAEAAAWTSGHDPVVLKVEKPNPRHHRYDQMAMLSPPSHRAEPEVPPEHEQTWQRSARDVGAIHHDAVIPPEKISVHQHIEREATKQEGPCPCCGTGEHPCGSECTACDGSGTLSAFSMEGGWRGCDLPHNPDCRCPHRHARSDRPWKRIFGPTHGLDHRLFDGDHLKPVIREHLMWKWHSFCDAFGLRDPDNWSIVYFSGSEASEWTGENLEGNNDFDILVGVTLAGFLATEGNAHRAEVMGWELTQEGVAQGLTSKLKADTGMVDDQYRLPGSADTGDEFDQTWFVNPDSYHIADIKPYAAYDCTHDDWAVRPPHLPGWSIDQFPEGPGLEEFCWGFEDMVRAVLDMPEPYRHQEGFALWHYVHDTRSNAFGPQGEGWYDVPNVLEKWLDQKGLMTQLWTLMHEATEDPHLLDSPADWSNTPVLAHLVTFNDPRWPEVVALGCVSPERLARVAFT